MIFIKKIALIVLSLLFVLCLYFSISAYNPDTDINVKMNYVFTDGVGDSNKYFIYTGMGRHYTGNEWIDKYGKISFSLHIKENTYATYNDYEIRVYNSSGTWIDTGYFDNNGSTKLGICYIDTSNYIAGQSYSFIVYTDFLDFIDYAHVYIPNYDGLEIEILSNYKKKVIVDQFLNCYWVADWHDFKISVSCSEHNNQCITGVSYVPSDEPVGTWTSIDVENENQYELLNLSANDDYTIRVEYNHYNPYLVNIEFVVDPDLKVNDVFQSNMYNTMLGEDYSFSVRCYVDNEYISIGTDDISVTILGDNIIHYDDSLSSAFPIYTIENIQETQIRIYVLPNAQLSSRLDVLHGFVTSDSNTTAITTVPETDSPNNPLGEDVHTLSIVDEHKGNCIFISGAQVALGEVWSVRLDSMTGFEIVSASWVYVERDRYGNYLDTFKIPINLSNNESWRGKIVRYTNQGYDVALEIKFRAVEVPTGSSPVTTVINPNTQYTLPAYDDGDYDYWQVYYAGLYNGRLDAVKSQVNSDGSVIGGFISGIFVGLSSLWSILSTGIGIGGLTLETVVITAVIALVVLMIVKLILGAVK